MPLAIFPEVECATGVRERFASSLYDDIQIERLDQERDPWDFLLQWFTTAKYIVHIWFLSLESLQQVRSQIVSQSVRRLEGR